MRIGFVGTACALSIAGTACGGQSGERGDVGVATFASATGSSSGSDDGTTAASTGSSTSDDGSSSSSTTGAPGPVGPYVVMTFNVLCAICSGDYPPWSERVPWMGDTIARHDPDLLGLQEVSTAAEVDEIAAAAPGYTAVYFHSSRNAYADALVFYREDRFTEVEHGFFWLSPTPDVPFSTGFADGFQLARLTAWVRLVDLQADREILFATTHFDNNSPSQELSAPLVIEQLAALGGEAVPTILVGDFNAQPSDPAYATLTDGIDGQGFRFADVFDLAQAWSVDTNQRPLPVYDPATRIDHLFVAGATWQSEWWTVDMHAYGDSASYVSDHFAIASRIVEL